MHTNDAIVRTGVNFCAKCGRIPKKREKNLVKFADLLLTITEDFVKVVTKMRVGGTVILLAMQSFEEHAAEPVCRCGEKTIRRITL